MPALVAFIGALLGIAVLIVGPALGLTLFGGGITWMTGNHERGKSLIIAALIGCAIALTAKTIADQVVALPH